MFPNCSSVITKHVAIICLRPSLSLESTLVSMDERVAVASVKDQHHHTVCRVINVYAPADQKVRQDFLCTFLSLPFVSEVNADPWVLLGDFNMNLHTRTVIQKPAVKPWYEWIMTHFDNCFPQGSSTFTRGDSRSTIDYIFGHHSIATRLAQATLHYMPPDWTDHSLLAVDLLPPRQDQGRGTWRFNPTLLTNDTFVKLLDETINLFFDPFNELTAPEGSSSPQAQWESLKIVLKCTAQQFSRGSTSRRKKQLTKLQEARQQALTIPSSPGLAVLENNIDSLIKENTQHAMLRSATRWHENGERNNKYFYQVIKTRQAQQTIQSLKSTTTGEVLFNTQEIIKEARSFYQHLYTPEEINTTAVDGLLSNIPPNVKLDTADRTQLMATPHTGEVMDILDHSPSGKSPGLDGIPFEVYKHLAGRSMRFRSLLLTIIQDACHGVFPQTWCSTRMVLLYKKGDPELLANWRPLSLINTDAKLFTKMLANRVNAVLPRLINPYQTGFMPHRLISDNGWLNQILMHNSRQSNTSKDQVAVLLDQEKAYDRVHPEYLRRTLIHFGFPDAFVSTLSHLFFNTQIHISINGWLGAPFEQGRGLRQGDPLSPLLFNLAFEPLLRTILSSPLTGVSLSPITTRRDQPSPTMVHDPDTTWDSTQQLDCISASFMSQPSPVKLLSYADDLEVFLSCPNEWPILLDILNQYGQASNARVNLSKTVVMPLSGQANSTWRTQASDYGAQWHDASSLDAVRYLGYPLYHTQTQLLNFLDGIKVKIARHANILKARNLSIRGSSLVANSLLLSRLWHVLRVIPAPESWLKEVKSIVQKFVLPFWPAPAWTTLCLPRRFGGIGLIDIEDQSLALHFIYVQRLCIPHRSSDFLSPWIIKYYQVLTGHASLLPWFLFPSSFTKYLAKDDNMAHLNKLIARLPSLDISPEWSGRWLLDLPLQNILPQEKDKPKLSSRYLLSDIVSWHPRKHCFIFHAHRLRPSLTTMVNKLHENRLDYAFATIQLNNHVTIKLYRTLLLTPPPQPYSPPTSLMPSLTHWNQQITSSKRCDIPALSLGQIRRIWHPNWKAMFQQPRPPEIVHPFSLCFSTAIWRQFWHLSLPNKSITVWWRILHDSVAYRTKLHRWEPSKYPSTECPICQAAPETLYHMIVDCPRKRPFWLDALQHYQLLGLLPSQDSLWHAFTQLRSTNGSPLPPSVLIRLGCILAVLWRHHWRCIIDDEPWISATAFNTLKSDILYQSFVPSD